MADALGVAGQDGFRGGAGSDGHGPRSHDAFLIAGFLRGRLGGQGRSELIVLERIADRNAAGARRAAARAARTARAGADAGDAATMSAAGAAGKEAVERAADLADGVRNDAEQRPAARIAARRAAAATTAVRIAGRLIIGPR